MCACLHVAQSTHAHWSGYVRMLLSMCLSGLYADAGLTPLNAANVDQYSILNTEYSTHINTQYSVLNIPAHHALGRLVVISCYTVVQTLLDCHAWIYRHACHAF